MSLKEIDYPIQKPTGLVDIEKGVSLNRLELFVNLILHSDDIFQPFDRPSIVL
jgi:hypothetical protein